VLPARRARDLLFWALRGGAGNFGVVTCFTFGLHPVGPEVRLGLLVWELGRGARALAMVRDRCVAIPGARAGHSRVASTRVVCGRPLVRGVA
jgi:FAD/FMN-containing dehydrogenase